MNPPSRLVPDSLPPDSVGALRELLAAAIRGEIIGVAFGALYRDYNFIVNATDEMRADPTRGRGIAEALADSFGRLQRGE